MNRVTAVSTSSEAIVHNQIQTLQGEGQYATSLSDELIQYSSENTASGSSFNQSYSSSLAPFSHVQEDNDITVESSHTGGSYADFWTDTGNQSS